MADEKHDTPRPFDVRTVEYLLKLMTDHDLCEVDLKEGDQRIRLRKGAAIPSAFLPTPAECTPTPATAPISRSCWHQHSVPCHFQYSNSDQLPPHRAKKHHEIKSELVGTFYTKPQCRTNRNS